MSGADKFTVVAPGIGEGIPFGRFAVVKSEARRLPDKMSADVSFVGFTMGVT
jgi:hypothetical protein